jgi:hypothetical protein
VAVRITEAARGTATGEEASGIATADCVGLAGANSARRPDCPPSLPADEILADSSDAEAFAITLRPRVRLALEFNETTRINAAAVATPARTNRDGRQDHARIGPGASAAVAALGARIEAGDGSTVQSAAR